MFSLLLISPSRLVSWQESGLRLMYFKTQIKFKFLNNIFKKTKNYKNQQTNKIQKWHGLNLKDNAFFFFQKTLKPPGSHPAGSQQPKWWHPETADQTLKSLDLN